MTSAPLPHRQSGVALVEFALVSTVLLLLTAGIYEFGRAFWHYNALAKATRDGARYMTTAAKGNLNSVGVPAAKSLVVAAANAANLSPALTSAEVDVSCRPTACSDGTMPVEVTVAISGYAIDIGAIFPFMSGTPPSAATTFAGVSLEPYTTMRYMNEEVSP